MNSDNNSKKENIKTKTFELTTKQIYILVCLACLFFAIILSFVMSKIKFDTLAKNEGIAFSRESGFYSNDFDLEIKGNGDIYYTLDGSLPTSNSMKYEGPIHISDASNNPNGISMRRDIATELMVEEINKRCISHNCAPDYQLPEYLIDKCTIVRAVAISPDNKMSKVKSASYFIGFNKKEGYNGINVASLITDNKNLFDYDYGIYVTGHDFQDWLDAPENQNYELEEWVDSHWWNANYFKRGRNSERPAHIDFFNENKNFIFGKDLGIRIQGNNARGFPYKGLKLYARKEYDGKNKFTRDLTDINYFPQRLSFSNGSNDFTNTKDYIVQTMVKDKNFGNMHYKPYALFINGEYWGFYWLTERFDEVYISHYYGIKDTKNIIMIKNHRILKGDNQDMELYNRMIDYISNNDLNIKENYEIAKKLIDIDSFIEYYGVQIYIDNRDWPHNNFALWRTKTTDGQQGYEDGRWRWLLFDINCGITDHNYNYKDELINNDPFFAHLMENKEIKHKFAEEMIKLSLNEFEPGKIVSFVEQCERVIQKPMKKHIERFYGQNNQGRIDQFSNETENIKNFFTSRPRRIREQFCPDLDYNRLIDKKVKEICEDYR